MNKRTTAKLQELRGPWGKDDKIDERRGRKQRAKSSCKDAATEEFGQHADPGGHSFFHLRFQQTQMQVKAGLRKGVSNPQHVSSLPRADHSPLSHTYVLAVTLPELSCLLFLCLQAATLLSNGDSVSGQITPRMM